MDAHLLLAKEAKRLRDKKIPLAVEPMRCGADNAPVLDAVSDVADEVKRLRKAIAKASEPVKPSDYVMDVERDDKGLLTRINVRAV